MTRNESCSTMYSGSNITSRMFPYQREFVNSISYGAQQMGLQATLTGLEWVEYRRASSIMMRLLDSSILHTWQSIILTLMQKWGTHS